MRYKLQNYNFIIKYEPEKKTILWPALSHDPQFMKEDAPVPVKNISELCKSDCKYIRYRIRMEKLQVINTYNMKYEDMARLDLHLEDLKDSVDKHDKGIIHFLGEEKMLVSRNNICLIILKIFT